MNYTKSFQYIWTDTLVQVGGPAAIKKALKPLCGCLESLHGVGDLVQGDDDDLCRSIDS